ncbi:hypothetical protein ACLQ20_02120 [Micromonospora sp. DT46]|uniref:hypothetical protein n=1 Tax=unclassified Micromonospora TaxID=2617518 RepID=UPI00124B9DD4|nr:MULTISPECIES: hypothetical protein [unclassified Micromonospora]KAB1145881.1 hypothetical protein F6X68_19480 [Micromonospora sp. AMSO12t]WSG04240.1 hypothetical protein OG989_11295 [Micromonospora sp. NBC_01740]
MPGPPRELVHRLYTTPPDRFVAIRDEAVAEARRAGDPKAAREIARLRRPTVAAWLVNLLAIRRPELVADLAQLAEALRTAQRELRGPRLRELSTQRRAVVGALVAEVRKLAAGAEEAPPAGKLPLGEVEATLNAALADTDVAEQVRSGRLLRAATYAGFGEVPRPQLRLVTGGEEPEPEPRPEPTGKQRGGVDRAALRAEQAERAARAERARRRRALEKELARARTDQERAEAELAGATAAERDGVGALDAIEAELAELERRRAVAEQDLSRARLARRGAERTVTAARRRAGEVEAAVEALDAEEGDAESGGGAAD